MNIVIVVVTSLIKVNCLTLCVRLILYESYSLDLTDGFKTFGFKPTTPYSIVDVLETVAKFLQPFGNYTPSLPSTQQMFARSAGAIEYTYRFFAER